LFFDKKIFIIKIKGIIMAYTLTTDGSRSSDAKHVGYAGYISDSNGKILFVFYASEKGTGRMKDPANADFELRALKAGLEHAISMGITDLVCHSDSLENTQICTRHMNNLNAIENEASLKKAHKEKFAEVFSLCRQFETLSFKHLPREQNQYADYLSHIWRHPTKRERKHFFKSFINLGGAIEYDYFEMSKIHAIEKQAEVAEQRAQLKNEKKKLQAKI
jgi:ribonuclease HI